MSSWGIDFGTSNCTVASWDGSVRVQQVGDDRPSDWALPGFDALFPSSFAQQLNERLFGWPAKLHPDASIDAVKRVLANSDRFTLGKRTYSSRHVAGLLFGALRERVERTGSVLGSAVVTVPSNATGEARFRTREAAGMAGLRVKALINEPTAAALTYVNAVPDTHRVMIYDWGGGTIDVTLLEFADGIYEERASRGIVGLGGLEVDKRLLDELVRPRLPRDWLATPRSRRQLSLEIERVKIALSAAPDPDTCVTLLVPETNVEIELAREELEGAIRFIVDQTLAPVRAVLNDTGIDAIDIDALVMVGGGSSIPLVRKRLSDFLETEPVAPELIDPMTAVGQGAAIAAAAIDGTHPVTLSVLTNRSLGTRTIIDGVPTYSEVIPRGVPLPYQETKRYTPHARSRSLALEIWETEGREYGLEDKDSVRLAELKLQHPGEAPPKDGRFELTYRYDVDGILHITALSLTGRKLVDDAVDFFGDRVADINPEIDDIQKTFPDIREQRRKAATSAVSLPAARPVRHTAAERVVLVVDASNVARAQRPEGAPRASFKQLQDAVGRLAELYPGARIYVIADANLKHHMPPEDKQLYQKALEQGWIIQVPAGAKGGADPVILSVAGQSHGIAVSNDAFREYQAAHPWLRRPNRLLGYSLVGGKWYFQPRIPPQPLKREDLAHAQKPAPIRSISPLVPQTSVRPEVASSLPVGWENSSWYSGGE